jgi:FG-GAP repeat
VARPDGEAYVVENRGSYRRADGSEEEYVNGPLGVGGGTAIVGAPYHLVGSGSGAGAAYVFVQSGTTWAQQAELSASDGAANDYFGYSVSVSGGTAIVGAPNHQTGAAYVFVQNGTTWAQQAELSASDGEASDYFGGSVSLSNGTAIVGANGYQVGSNVQAGAAYVFVQNGTTWAQQAELSASDGAANDYFGYSVSVSGGTAIVGAINHQIGSNPRAGAACVRPKRHDMDPADRAHGERWGDGRCVWPFGIAERRHRNHRCSRPPGWQQPRSWRGICVRPKRHDMDPAGRDHRQRWGGGRLLWPLGIAERRHCVRRCSGTHGWW